VPFAALQEACDLPKSTTSRMLTALQRSELLERRDDGSYVAGSLFWLYAARHDPGEDLVRLATPTLAAIGEETHETVNLSVARADRVLQVAQVDSRFILGSRDWTQIDVPAHCSSLGKVFLAWDAAASEQSNPEELGAIRARGYATAVDELEVGLTALAAPVFGGDGNTIAALSISGPTIRLTRSRIEELAPGLVQHAHALSRKLGHQDDKRGAA